MAKMRGEGGFVGEEVEVVEGRKEKKKGRRTREAND